MTTKEYLSQISRYNRMIANKLQEISQLKMIAYSISPQNVGEKVQNSYKADKISGIVTEIADKEKVLNTFLKKRTEIVNQIESISDINCYDILTNRYVLEKSIKVISVERGMAEKYLISMQKNALKIFEKKYGEIYLSTNLT